MSGLGMRWRETAAGLLAGLLGGLVVLLAARATQLLGTGEPLGRSPLPVALAIHLALSGLVGVGFAWLFGRTVRTSGAGLMWGIGYGMLGWLIGPMTLGALTRGGFPRWTIQLAQANFPSLLGHLVGYGAALGLSYPVFITFLDPERRLARTTVQRALALLRAAVIGGLAGFIGGLAFGAWMARVGFFPLVAGLVGSTSPNVGRALHLLISVTIGGTFGVLFRGDIRGIGSSIAWGVAYGFIWWILGPLTLMPWWLGRGVQWSLTAAQAAFPSLIGHVIYGILLGVVFAAVDRLWRLLFSEADPLRREPEGPAMRSLRALGMGVLASIAGGLAFTVVMLETGALPTVAGLVGRSSPLVGFGVHMLISAILGATYGLLFRREAYSYGAGLAWGSVYGLAWWFLGPLTLMPILLGAGVRWSLSAASAAYPSLIGHLAYGAMTALTYQLLVQRYSPTARGRVRLRRHAGTPAPALWALVLLMGVLLPLMLSLPGN